MRSNMFEAKEEGIAVQHYSSDLLMIVILLGPPGSGKGTHARLLSEHLHIPHISTSDLLREQISSQSFSPFAHTVKTFMDQGKLVPDELVVSLLFERMQQSDCANGCILDGFPRTLSQARILDEKFKKKHHIIALHFHISNSILIERMTGRMICQNCTKPYHETFDPPLETGFCNDCGGALIIRKDDQENVVRKRLEIYHDEIEPLIRYYAEQKHILHEIDAYNAKNRVFHDILEVFPSKKKSLMKLYAR